MEENILSSANSASKCFFSFQPASDRFKVANASVAKGSAADKSGHDNHILR
jgi:hypothetical protein